MGPVVVMSSAPGARFRGLAGELCHARENGTFRVKSGTLGRGSRPKSVLYAKLLASFEREAHVGWFEAEVVAQPTAPNHYLHSPVLEMSVGRVRPGGSASVSGKKPCPLSRLREDNDSVSA